MVDLFAQPINGADLFPSAMNGRTEPPQALNPHNSHLSYMQHAWSIVSQT